MNFIAKSNRLSAWLNAIWRGVFNHPPATGVEKAPIRVLLIWMNSGAISIASWVACSAPPRRRAVVQMAAVAVAEDFNLT